MKYLICRSIAALALLAGVDAQAASNRPTTLNLHTQDDDLRRGGAVTFVLRMRDGTEQATPLINGEALPGGSTKEFQVGPRPPYDWAQVKDLGLRVRPDRGDGMLLQPDQWKVYLVLRGQNATCSATMSIGVGDACFTHHNGRLHFQREETQWIAFNPIVGKCKRDAQCADTGNFCSPHTMSCNPRAANADVRGCALRDTPLQVCTTGQICDAERRRCVTPGCENPDKDGDGENSVACGGNDCDDDDRGRRPGGTEVCDNAGKDEDCDFTTFGDRDSDGDGFVDSACWNDQRQRR
jgi:hypothetical protein